MFQSGESCIPILSIHNCVVESSHSGLHRSSQITGAIACGKKVYRGELIHLRIFKLIQLWEEGMKPLLDGSALSRNSPANTLLIPVYLTDY